MINDILDLSKVEAGKMLVEMDAVNLTELPSLLQGYFGKLAEAQNVEFNVTLNPEVPDLFFTDEMRLHQILRNLLSNAFKFTEQGSVTMEITKLAEYSDQSYIAEGPVLAFAVQDTGIGISEENREPDLRGLPPSGRNDCPQIRGNRSGLVHLPAIGSAIGRAYQPGERRGQGQYIHLVSPLP